MKLLSRKLADGAPALAKLSVLLFCFLTGLGASGPAQAKAIISIEPFNEISHTWDGVGDVQRTAASCVKVSAGPNERRYAVMADQFGGSAADFLLTGADASTLPFSLMFNSNPQTSLLTLQPGSNYAGDYPGTLIEGCSNAEVIWYFSAADLQAVPAGMYTDEQGGQSSLYLHTAWSNNFNKIASERLRFRLSIPPLVSISGLDDIRIHTDGQGLNLSAGLDSFCVWSNTGSYRMTVTSAVRDSGIAGTFAVTDGNLTIPYELLMAGDAAGGQSVAVTNGGVAGPFPANTLARDCDGTDNASMQINFSRQDIMAADWGVYSATLVLRVEPD